MAEDRSTTAEYTVRYTPGFAGAWAVNLDPYYLWVNFGALDSEPLEDLDYEDAILLDRFDVTISGDHVGDFVDKEPNANRVARVKSIVGYEYIKRCSK